jgi:lysophospholipase L1-like esterase
MTRKLALSALALFAFIASAQQPTAAPAPPPATPAQAAIPQDPPLNPALPTVFIVGDSTARNNVDLGWGDHFAQFFDTTRINVANRSRAGRSTRSYYNEGLWAHTFSEIKSGDYVLFQMGHNDGGGTADTVLHDAKSRTTIHSLGDETVDVPILKPFATGPLAGLTVETVHTYGWYMRMYFAAVRAKGATPILLTPTIRNIWKPDASGTPQIERDMGFREIDTQLAAAEHVPLIDTATIEAGRLQALGPEKTALLFPIDHTHSSAIGAEAIAHDVTLALRAAHSPVAAYLKPEGQ